MKPEPMKALKKYVLLSRKLEETRADRPFTGSVRDVGGMHLSSTASARVIEHLIAALREDPDDDNLRSALAYEAWRVCKFDQAKMEYELLASRETPHAVTAAKMLAEIEARRTKVSHD